MAADTWGTLANSLRADGAVHALAEMVDNAVNVSPASPKLGNPAAGSSLAAEALAAEADPELVRRYQQCAKCCGYLVMAIGCIGLIGWLTGVAVLTSLNPRWIAIKVNSSLGLIAAAGALCLNVGHRGKRGPATQVSRLCTAFIIVLAGATLIEDVSGVDFGIDQILMAEPVGAVGTAHLGRMAPLSALTFTIFGMSLFAMPLARDGWQLLSSALALFVTVVSTMMLLGYIFGAAELYTVSGRFQAVAANTSIAFFVLGCGITFANLPIGPLRSLTSPYLGGMMVRRMLPAIVALITSIVWLRVIAQSAGLFESNEFGVASGTVVIIIAMAGILIWCGGVLDRIDGARRHGDHRISQLNTTLNSRIIALEAADKELQGFSYSMSHVLRAPLRAIHGYAQIVLDDLGDTLNSEGKRLLGAMQSSAGEMSELLDGILAFLRLGWQPMTIVAVDMAQGVRAAITLLENKTAGREISFEIGELPDAQADAMVQRIWLNLLDNAIKFTCCKDAARIEVGAQIGSGQTVYFVKDNGAGFDMQYAAKLFGVFQRLHDTTQFPGTGIGLAIVNRIVARHGGRVWAEGKPDEGATFYFSLTGTENIHA